MKDNYTKSEVQEMREKIKAATPVPVTREALTNLVELIIGQPLAEKEPEELAWTVWEKFDERVILIPHDPETLTAFFPKHNELSTSGWVQLDRAEVLKEMKLFGYKLIGHATPSFTITPV